MSIPSLSESMKPTPTSYLSSNSRSTEVNSSDWNARRNKLYDGFSKATRVAIAKVSSLYSEEDPKYGTFFKLMSDLQLTQEELKELSQDLSERAADEEKFWKTNPEAEATPYNCKWVVYMINQHFINDPK